MTITPCCKRITLVLYIFLFIACKSKTGAKQEINTPPVKKDIIVLNNKLKENQFASLLDISRFEKNIFPVVFNKGIPAQYKIFTKDPVFLLLNDLSTVFILNPGEQVDLQLNDSKKLTLSIKNNPQRTDELFFFQDLNNKYPEPIIKPLKITRAADFKNADAVYTKWYSDAITFLNSYQKIHKISTKFVSEAGKYLYYKRLADLLTHIYSTPGASDFIAGTAYDKFPECDSCITMPHYCIAMYYYNKILQSAEPSVPSFANEFDTAKAHFTGNSRAQLLYTILNGYLNSSFNSLDFNKRISYFFAAYPRDTLTTLLKFNYNIKLASLSKGPAFDEKVLGTNGTMIKWSDLLLKYKDKVILIDFWARYCGPCVYEIPFSQSLEKKYNKKDIAFIYVSFDQSKANWLTGMDALNFANTENSYLHLNTIGSGIAKYYNTSSIPKYAVYDKKGKLVTVDAPRPSDPALKKLLDKLVTE